MNTCCCKVLAISILIMSNFLVRMDLLHVWEWALELCWLLHFQSLFESLFILPTSKDRKQMQRRLWSFFCLHQWWHASKHFAKPYEKKSFPQKNGITKTMHWTNIDDSSLGMVFVLLFFRLWTALSKNTWDVNT